ncbi:MAG: helix-turn-helix domain-containing protein [Eubacteriales bacterium]|nr:helix-turn-helix domain-containing protein [Eubacteriales bacterium]
MDENKTEKLALNAKEAAALIGVALPTMYKIMKEPDFPVCKIGRRNLIPRSGLQSWLDNAAQSGKVLQW